MRHVLFLYMKLIKAYYIVIANNTSIHDKYYIEGTSKEISDFYGTLHLALIGFLQCHNDIS